MNRENWSSGFTYILAIAGATIGFGATWRFPYLVGENGGGAYVIIFCLAMVLIGVPMILVENAIGRRLSINSIDAFGGKVNGNKISKIWKIVGYMGLLGAFGIMAYYMVIGGWVLNYIYKIINQDIILSSPLSPKTANDFFNLNINNSPVDITIATIIFVIVNFVILIKGAVKGIERAAKYLMPIFFVLILFMVYQNLKLPGAIEGVKFYLNPDFSKINAKLFIDVLGQVFFALSIGYGVMITMSSFVDKKEGLVKISFITVILNTLIAFLSGFMIFPSLFSFDIAPSSGPTLIFKSLPIVFSNMAFGEFFAISFFGLLMIAALTTSLSIYEVIITAMQEKFKFTRRASVLLSILFVFFLGNLPSLMSYNILKDITFFGKNIFEAYDAISANIFFVLTALFSSIFVGWILKEEAKNEILRGSEKYEKLINYWFVYVKFVVPFIILIVFISSFYDNFLKVGQ